jgi:filamentous hemagglutinin family protein
MTMNRLSSGRTTGPLRRKCLPLLIAACCSAAQATPTVPQVVAGQATFAQQGNVYSITNTPNTIINWQSFSVGAGEVTRFIQQSSSSAVLNRILGQDPSQILGALQSNGRVFLINPNGVMFGAGSRVDVNGLVASSLAISNADFLAGRNNFTDVANAGKVSNAGSITTPSGGQVFLVAPNVDNSGIITSPQGDVILAAGHAVQFVDAGNPSVQVVVSAPDNAALNLGKVIAQGGRIGIYGALVNQRGHLNANSAVLGENGKIVLKASRDTLLEAGSVTSATGAGQGGEVSVLGQRVALTGDARVDASGQTGGGTVLVGGDYQGKNAAVQNARQTVVGTDARIQADAIASGDGGKIVVWADGATSMAGRLSARGGAAGGDGGVAESSGKQTLDFRGTADLRAPRGKAGSLLLDPNDIYITTGSDTYITPTAGSPFVFESTNTPAVLTPATLTTQLGLSDVSVYTASGSITVQSPVSWSTASELTLSAANGIAVNAAVTNAAGGKLSLYAGGGDISQTAAITVPTLAAIASSGNMILSHSGNSVGTLAGSSDAQFTFNNAGALIIGTVSGGAIPTQTGVTSSSGGISISSGVGNSVGGMSINGAVSASSGMLNLRDYVGDITQSAPLGATQALIIADQGAVTLNNTSNSLGTLAGYSNGASGFSYVNAGALTVGTVSGSHGVLSFGAAPLSLTALSGDLTISDTTYGAEAGNSGLSAMTLAASGGQVLGSGIVKGGAVGITAATGISLTGAQNEIGTLSAAVTGSGNVALVNNQALSIASVSTGAANAAIDISTTAASAFGINVAGTIDTGATGSVTLNAGGSGAITRTGAASVISANTITLQNTSSGAIGTSGSPLLTAALSSGTTDFVIGASGSGPQGLYLNQAGRMSLNSASHYGTNAAIAIDATNDLTIGGNLSAGTANMALSSAGAIQVLGSNVITAGALDMKAASGIYGSSSSNPISIVAGSVQAQNTTAGPIRLSNSGTNLVVGGASAYGIDQQGGGAVYLDNASGYTTTINKSIGSAGGSIGIYGSGGIALSAAQSIASGGGSIQLFAFDTNAQLSMAAGSSVTSGGGLINLKADAMAFTGSALHAGSGGVAIGPGNGDTLIRAGVGAADVSGAPGTRVLGLTETELRTVDTTGYIYLGNGSQTADVTISGALDLYNGGALSGGLSLNGGSGNVIINDVLTTGQVTIAASNAAKTITIGNGGMLQTHGTTVFNAQGGVVLSGNGGVATNGSVLYMQGTTGVTLNGTSSIATAGGQLTIDAGSTDGVITTQAGTSISGGGAAPALTADNMNLAGSISSTSAVSLAPHTAGVQVKVGALAADSSGVLRLTNAELNGVHAPILRIGVATSGAIVIESALDNLSGHAFEHVSSALSLTSGGAITQSAGATVDGISKAAFTGASVTLDQANGTGRIAGSTSGSFAYRSANQVSVESVDGLSGVTAGAGQTIKLKSDGAGIGQNAGAPLYTSGGTLVLEAAGPAQLALLTNNFGTLGGALNQGGTGTKGASEIYAGSNLTVGAVTAIDGVTTINGLSTNNQDLELSTGFVTHQLTVNKPINAGTANATLETDNLALNDTVTGNTVVLQPHTVGRPITVGSATCQVGGVGGCLAITRLDRVAAPNIGIGRRYADPEAPGELYVAGITTAGTAVATDINPLTTLIGLGSGGTITQGGPIVVNTLGLSAGGVITLADAGNLISTLAAETNGTAVSYSNSAGFAVGALPSNTLIEGGGGSLAGVHTIGGNVTLAAGGGATSELAISQLINAGSGDVVLTSPGAVYGGTGSNDITAGTLSVMASGSSTRGGGIGAIDGSGGLHTTVPRIASLTAPAAGIRVASLSDLVVGPASAASGDVVSTTGALALSTATGHPLTINGDLTATGNIDLTAGSAGSSNTLDQINFAQNVTSSGGNITINANGATGIHLPSGGNVTSHLYVATVPAQPPSLAACIANPALSGCAAILPGLEVCTSAPTTLGCSAVLPSVAVCTSAPTTAGCSAVLPSLAVCTTDPTTAGCSAVLPSVSVCAAAPATAGCSAVLPTITACAADPTLPGCSAVLPTVAVCAATPTLPGCSAVLPTVAACTLTPALPGCSAVLPTVAACAAAPTLPGCSAVLPTVAACTISPGLPGCSAVLPTVAACTGAPTLPGCSAVLPTVAACTAAPNLPGCSAVLPTVAACTGAPGLPGCSAVLPTVTACTVAPNLPGCSVVLPTVAACAAAPNLPGCSAVLPTLAACTITPTLAGCSGVLPSLSVCVAAPGTAGCSAVLPGLDACVATPGAAGCSAVLPSLATCSSAPATAGCGAVLPTLAQCVVTPALAGCSVVLPPVDVCVSNPGAAGCVAVVPPIQSQPDGPVAQALNTTINVINTVTITPASPAGAARTSSGGGSGSGAAGGDTGSSASTGGPAATSSTPDDGDGKKNDDKKDTVVAQQTETKKEVSKKTYCN